MKDEEVSEMFYSSPSTKEWRALHTICGLLAVSTGVYMGLGWFLVARRSFPIHGFTKPGGLALSLAVAAILFVLAAPLLQRLLAQDREARLPSMPKVPFETYRQAIIVAFGVREGAAILGLVNTLLMEDVRWVLALGGAAVLAMGLGWPSRQRWKRLNAEPQLPPAG